MVTHPITAAAVSLRGLAEVDAAKPVLEQLDPPKRAAVVMALLGITLVGMFLVVLAMVGGHWVRRMARHRPGEESRRRRESARANAAFRESLQSVLPEAKTEDTIQYGTSAKDTKVDL